MGLERRQDEIWAEAIQKYLISCDCFERKKEYVGGFIKLKFYLGCSFLESHRPGESFDDMIYSEVILGIDSLD